ncbi:MAG: GH39 family glycosyl hydrolase [Inquilinus sp.]|uniref:GH39 family glycosyl hydrolase n=1 Tax=Inquilinus sp. TaxID=1932117 RepID=UPI003F2BB4B6
MTATPIRVDLNGPARPWKRFWRSTGFSPAELLLEPEMQQALAHLGAVPNRGIEYLRVHYMLDLVKADRLGAYDWTLLDQALDAIIGHRLRPFFELMGNPGKLYTDLNQDVQVRHWRDLVEALARRCIERYGAEEVRTWYFETWNEPDIWWKLGGETGFNNYYDACSEGLKAVDPALRLGGPGVARRVPPIFRSFLAHCDTGTNFFTGETGVRLDFISVHEKGAVKHPEDLTPNTVGICRHEMEAVSYIREHHPRFASLPFINDECDPQIGWEHYHTWHAMPYFAGLIAKVIDQHQRLLVEAEGVDYDILSNDNGFLGRWGQRTHLAFFGARQFDAAQRDWVTDLAALADRRANPEPFDYVKKPGLTVMELLALLGDRRVDAPGALDPDRTGLGIMATPTAEGGAVLLYNSVDRLWRSGTSPVALEVAGLAPGRYALGIFEIAQDKGDPFSIWEAQAAATPTHADQLAALSTPNAAQLAAMRRAQEPALTVREVEIGADGRLALDLELLLPAVALVVLARDEAGREATPATNIRVRRDRGLNGPSQLLFWDPPAGEGVRLFDVLWSAAETGPFEAVNPVRLLSSVYLHAADRGFYRIRTTDLAGRELSVSAAVAAG